MTPNVSGTRWVTQQILALPSASAPRVNPRKGRPIPGSAATAVIDYLRSRPGLFMQHRQILAHTQHSTKAVGWALVYLQALRLIESVPDQRNPRYRRYRATEAKS